MKNWKKEFVSAAKIEADVPKTEDWKPRTDDREKCDILVKVGAMWQKKTKRGEDFYSVSVGRERYVAFKNGFKKEDKHPDFVVYQSAGNNEGYGNN